MGRLAGKVALITGAARGQGRAHAVRLAEEGATIIATDLCEQLDNVGYPLATPADLEETARLVEKQDQACLAVKADARDAQQMAAVVAQAIAEFGKIDILAVNHGILIAEPWDQWTEHDWNTVIDTNLNGVWNATRPVLPHMVEQGSGSVIFTASVSGLLAQVGMLPYNASKHGVVGLMRSLAATMGPHNVRVNTVCPGNVGSPMLLNDMIAKMFSGGAADATIDDIRFPAQAMNLLPVPWVEPVDVSNAVLFLASDEARYITGTNLTVDAGFFTTPRGVPAIAAERLAALD
ncbi:MULTISPECIES: mycofactocin-coupled SDR family oxidoreductase [Amycolatopsis]|uniref:SDR family mycofactocin-dependent oxidoreductase n=2 Tax=Amycolatopsis TaxID=1813 RepID=A0A1I3KD17_9PSEU|nr:mycofactocin-coupled SDR family oxidoreductase [Amycolatopsis sacchari]SFI70347.1 SDR family mycofactocin-dependent oxidoreductase [Amycolatopsis sacchari]